MQSSFRFQRYFTLLSEKQLDTVYYTSSCIKKKVWKLTFSLAMINYQGKFIANLSTIVSLATELLQKNK